MTEPEVFILADRMLESIVNQIHDDKWGMEMPVSFLRIGQEKVTLHEIINYHAYDDAWVPDMLAGRTMDEVGREKFDGELLDPRPKENFSRIVDKAVAAAKKVEDLERVVHCSFGDYTTREYFWQINSFRGLRAHDIAKVIGADTRLPDALVEGLWEEVAPHADEWRKIGVFPAKVEVADDASLQDRLLGLTGRQPDGNFSER